SMMLRITRLFQRSRLRCSTSCYPTVTARKTPDNAFLTCGFATRPNARCLVMWLAQAAASIGSRAKTISETCSESCMFCTRRIFGTEANFLRNDSTRSFHFAVQQLSGEDGVANLSHHQGHFPSFVKAGCCDGARTSESGHQCLSPKTSNFFVICRGCRDCRPGMALCLALREGFAAR